MADYILSCCSTADLSREHFAARDISYICFHYELDGKQYADDLGQSMPFDKFYQAMANGAQTKTSQINAAEFIDYFTPFLEAGKDVLHVCLSSGISGVYNSACMARDELSEKFPERKIYVVDSLGASSGYGLLMDRLADLRQTCAVIEMDRNRHRSLPGFRNRYRPQRVKARFIGKTAPDLEHDRGLFGFRRRNDGLHTFHIENVKGTDGIAFPASLQKHFF